MESPGPYLVTLAQKIGHTRQSILKWAPAGILTLHRSKAVGSRWCFVWVPAKTPAVVSDPGPHRGSQGLAVSGSGAGWDDQLQLRRGCRSRPSRTNCSRRCKPPRNLPRGSPHLGSFAAWERRRYSRIQVPPGCMWNCVDMCGFSVFLAMNNQRTSKNVKMRKDERGSQANSFRHLPPCRGQNRSSPPTSAALPCRLHAAWRLQFYYHWPPHGPTRFASVHPWPSKRCKRSRWWGSALEWSSPGLQFAAPRGLRRLRISSPTFRCQLI